jgi:hypothetical protein
MQQNSPVIKNILSPAMRRHMREIPARTHFLLMLHAGVEKVDFIAVAENNEPQLPQIERARQAMYEAFSSRRAEIVNLPEELSSLSDSTKLFQLCFEIVTAAQELVPDLPLTENYIRAVAVSWLEEQSLPLGDGPKAEGEIIDPWRLSPADRAQLRFQDAVDYYAVHNCSLESARFSSDATRFDGCVGVGNRGNVVLKVPTPARRDGIVALPNLQLFVAEHLLAYNKSAARRRGAEEVEVPELTFFFLPLKGLGQVRAAIDWVGVGSKTGEIHVDLENQATKLQRVGLESLFTQSLIRSFGIALRDALRQAPGDDQRNATALHHAFADLWWAREIRFYKRGEFRVRLIRAEDTNATTWMSSRTQPDQWRPEWRQHEDITSDFVAIAGERHPGLSYVRLNLASLFGKHGDQKEALVRQLELAGLSEKDLEKTYDLFSFDEVVFACHFFRFDAGDLSEWVDQLAETVVLALIDQAIHSTGIVRSRAQALEGVAHWLNSLVRMAGRSRAARILDQVTRQLPSNDLLKVKLEQIFDSLQLLVLLEAGTGLLRLVGTLGEGDPGRKLGDWFTSSSMAEWRTPAAFPKYQASLTHLARAIGSSFGHPLVLVVCDGEQKQFSDYCALDLDEVLFPPLSKAEKGNEPILALLPALTEPISNALAYMRTKGLLGSDYPLVLEIEDHRDNEVACITVAIGSPYFEQDHLPSSHGVAIAGRLSKLTELAEIGLGEVRNCNGHPYYFVPVSIHPQMLAQQIENAHANSTKKFKAAHHR